MGDTTRQREAFEAYPGSLLIVISRMHAEHISPYMLEKYHGLNTSKMRPKQQQLI